jgi:hypothetical protein
VVLAPRAEFQTGTREERYLVHLHSWSCWQGTTETKRLAGPIDAKALTDKHPQLAKGAGVDVAASLDEVL